ncbi:MAG: nuclear transport factor 2 family protein [Bacteroidota bacterium]
MKTITINFDELKKSNWSDKEAENAALCLAFIQNLMNDHNFDYVLKVFANDSYKQHNRGIPDGINGLVEYLKAFVKRYPEYAYDVKHIYTDGDFVTFHSHVTLKAKHRGNDQKGLNIIDTWRIEDRKIVEHWDSIQPIDGLMRLIIWLTGGAIRNANGVY